MVSDAQAAQARQHHRAATSAEEDAARHRAARDNLIRTLRADDPARWTYKAIAAAVGCEPQLVRWIITGDRGRKR